MTYKVFREYINLISVHLAVCKSFRSSICLSICQLLDQGFALNVFTAYISACNHITGPEVIKLFSCSTQLSMKFFMLINVKMPTIVGILTFMSGKNNILCLSEPKKGQIS